MNTYINNQSLLSETDCQLASGGFVTAVIQTAEFFHGILIARETTNYIGKLWVEGCKGVTEDDYFTKFFCLPFEA